MADEETAALTEEEMDAVCNDLLDAAAAGDIEAIKIIGDLLDGPIESAPRFQARLSK